VCLKVTVTVQLVLRVNSERVTVELDRGKLKQCTTISIGRLCVLINTF